MLRRAPVKKLSEQMTSAPCDNKRFKERDPEILSPQSTSTRAANERIHLPFQRKKIMLCLLSQDSSRL